MALVFIALGLLVLLVSLRQLGMWFNKGSDGGDA